MPFYALNAVVTINPGGTEKLECSNERLDIGWPRPIEYASDLKEIQLHLAGQCLEIWRRNNAYRLTTIEAQAYVHVLSWQPLKGMDRPESEGGEVLV